MSWMTEDIEGKRTRRIGASIGLLLAAAVILIVWQAGTDAMEMRGLTWLYPWMIGLMPGVAVWVLFFACILWLPVKGTYKILAVTSGLLVFAAVLCWISYTSPLCVTVDRSPDGKHLLVLQEEKGYGAVTVCRAYYGFWKKEKEQLPFTIGEKCKLQWLQNDVCAVTYEAPDGKVHQYLATYGDRGDGISWQDPLSAVMGHWTVADTNHAGWNLTVEGGIVTIENGNDRWEYQDADCVRFGTTAIALCQDSLPFWSLVLNEDCQVNYDGRTADGGTLTLCPVSMDKTAALTFVCTDPKEPFSEQNPSFEQWGMEEDQAEGNTIRRMRSYVAGESMQEETPVSGGGIFYVASHSEEEAWNIRNALLTFEEYYRVNGVDVRVQVESVKRLAGSAKDGLYEVIFTELCISPGNQGAAPEGEKMTLNWRIRMMEAADGYYAYVLGWRDDGFVDIETGTEACWDVSGEEEYAYFLSGYYDTTYMYVSRRNPEEGIEAVYQKYLAHIYPNAVLAEYDEMPCMDLNGDQRTWLVYHGIAEDYENYEYRILELEEEGLSLDGRFEVKETYSIRIREES